ncbi:MAG: ABC transporter permease [Thermoleophilia bacterium]|nr:ABC transporter permease [Thermoleophilia bacterium]
MTARPVTDVPTPEEIRRAQLRGVAALCEREVVRVLRLWSQTILPQVLGAVLFIVVFGMALGGRIRSIDGVSYREFIVPGLVLMGVVTAAFANNATSLYQARSDGFIEDPVSSPMSPTQLALGYTAGGVVRGLLIGAGTLVAAAFFVPVHVANPVALVLAVTAAAVGAAALGTIIGLHSKGWELQAFTGTIVLQPLVFLGGVFYSVDDLRDPWHALTRANPILYMVEAVRYGMHGSSALSPWLSVGVTVAIAAALLGWSWTLFVRGTGLRT